MISPHRCLQWRSTASELFEAPTKSYSHSSYRHATVSSSNLSKHRSIQTLPRNRTETMNEQSFQRPPTPQTLIHRLPDKSSISADHPAPKPWKFIILIAASTAVAGKVQVAQSVSQALACPLFQGDSLHETAAKAARVGAGTSFPSSASSESGANEARYQRMWLSKMTRTGLLFPDESRAAGAGFSGFGGSVPAPPGSTTATRNSSRRGSNASSEASFSSSFDDGGSSYSTSTHATSITSTEGGSTSSSSSSYIAKPPVTLPHRSERHANPALMVLTHSDLELWQRNCIRKAVGEYGIGVIFVPLDEDAEPPLLKPLDPTTMSSFGSFFDRTARQTDWVNEVVLTVDVDAVVEDLAEEIVHGVRDLMFS